MLCGRLMDYTIATPGTQICWVAALILSASWSSVFRVRLALADSNGKPVNNYGTPNASQALQPAEMSHVDLDQPDNFTRPWKINKNVCPPVLCKKPSSGHHHPLHGHDVSGVTDFPFFQGDIVLDRHMHNTLFGNSSRLRVRRAVVRQTTRLWPNGVVPYVIEPTVDNVTQRLIQQAMLHISNMTCIQFRHKTEADTDYVAYVAQPGCWSYVGRVGGKQYISLGHGCEHFGTALHETTHALGFWHEQSRPDRDRYVRVIKKNMDERSWSQFEKHGDNESDPRGYAYDYGSVMHYTGLDYSENAQSTIKVIGIGRKLNLTIGQRKRLSDIDIAQLNDIYDCNRKKAEKRACQQGWVKFRSSCYNFVHNATLPFFAASRQCRAHRGRLVIIDNKAEDDFIKNYLSTHFINQTAAETWHTGAIRFPSQNSSTLNSTTQKSDVTVTTSSSSSLSHQFVWYLAGSKGKHQPMKYHAWPSDEDFSVESGSTRTMVLQVYNVGGNWTQRYEWRQTVQTDNTTSLYPYICEARTQFECFQSAHGDGREYRGTLSYTSTGVTCQRWSRQYPHNHTLLTGNGQVDGEKGLGNHNHCRNPGGMRTRPWCYVLLKNVPWQYCDVPICRHKL